MKNKIKGAVIVIKESVIDNSYPFRDESEANNIFLEKCRENISNFDSYDAKEIDVILEHGYETFGNGNSICIHWFCWEKK